MPVRREEDFFWEGVDRGELLAQVCLDCGTLRHPPSPRCARCRSAAWEARALSGRGSIHTWIVSRHPSQPDPDPRVVVLVDLEEGIRLVSNLVDPENVLTGAAVQVEFGDVDGRRLPLFRTTAAPAPGAG
jgi:uncharacterized OB-fold protein